MAALQLPAALHAPAARFAPRRRRRCVAMTPRCVGARFSDPPPPPPRRAPRRADPAGDELRGPRDACQTPHSGYHDDGARRRFFEGWCAPSLSQGLHSALQLYGSLRTCCNAPRAAAQRQRCASVHP